MLLESDLGQRFEGRDRSSQLMSDMPGESAFALERSLESSEELIQTRNDRLDFRRCCLGREPMAEPSA